MCWVFPELRESEDERIRKSLLDYLYTLPNHFSHNGGLVTDWIAWLEKQKVITTEEDLQGKEDVLWCIKQAEKYAKDENEMGTCWFAEKWFEKQGEQKPTETKGVNGNDREIPFSKQEWSEENEMMLDTCIDLIEHFPRPCGRVIGPWKDCIDWLKSLKDRVQPQTTWKPSDEQMDALRYVTNFDYGGYKATLVSLYKQLKKLRDEK